MITVANASTYATARSRYRKASAVLAAARERLIWTGADERALDYVTAETWAAMGIIERAAEDLNAEFEGVQKSFNIGHYVPYGRNFRRRF